MAKKKQETGPGTGMIVTLVFFVLATLILGVTTYMGFDGQTEPEGKAKEATDNKKKSDDLAAEERIRRNVDRVALGTAEEADHSDLAGVSGVTEAAMLDEHNRIMGKLGRAGAIPGGLQWALVNGKMPAAPRVTLPAITNDWAKSTRPRTRRPRPWPPSSSRRTTGPPPPTCGSSRTKSSTRAWPPRTSG